MVRLALKAPVLCLVTDPAYPNLVEAVEIALSEGVNMLQLRGPGCSAAQFYERAVIFRACCQRYGATFIVNDRLDVGLAVHADGFQLGGQSLPTVVARQVVGEEYLLGVSVHSVSEARAAVASGADFLIAGTIFASRSHPDGLTSGPALLDTIKQAAPDSPLLAIGGITADNAACVMDAGADGVAVISAILGATNIRHAVRSLRAAIGL
jgi:thiamine-phosphate diphosphorylase